MTTKEEKAEVKKRGGKIMYGYEGDTCKCGHAFYDHSWEDKTDGTEQGCQILGCHCKNVWLESR